MTMLGQMNLDAIHSVYFREGAERGKLRLGKYIRERRDEDALHLLRHHEEQKITDKETVRRDEIDYLLSYYSILRVAYTAGVIDIEDFLEPLLEGASEILSFYPVQRYYEEYYPLPILSRFRGFFEAPEAWQTTRERITPKKSYSIFSEFLLLSELLEFDDQIETFLWLLEGGHWDDWDYDRFVHLLRSPQKAALLLSNPTEDQTGKDVLLGSVKFLDFSASLNRLLRRTSAQRKLAEEMYLCHAYWFDASSDLTTRLLKLLESLSEVGGNVTLIRRQVEELAKRGRSEPTTPVQLSPRFRHADSFAKGTIKRASRDRRLTQPSRS